MNTIAAFWLALIIKGVLCALSAFFNCILAVGIFTLTIGLPLALVKAVFNFFV